LEATTARKGNRKVSLTISGWVAEQVMWWDDGFESNAYVQGIGTTLASNIKFTGSAQISPGWSAGYVIHVEVYGSENLGTTNQSTPVGPSLYDNSDNFNGINTLQSFWFIKSEHLGKVSIGYQSQASDNTAILPDGSGSLVPANFVQFDYGGFFIRGTDGTFGSNWFAGGCSDCNGLTTNNVRYDSPTWHGFSVSGSWGDDDFWDVAARYAGEWAGFKTAVAAAYSETSTAPIGPVIAQAPDTQFFQIGAYAEHIPSGLFLYGAYGTIETDNNLVNGQAGFVDNDFWYVKAGLRRRWHPLGHTVIYGEYEKFDNEAQFGAGTPTAVGGTPQGSAGAFDGGCSSSNNFNATANFCTAEVQLWGVGVVQEIDAAAMSIWLTYRNLEADIHNVDTGNDIATEDFQYVKFGALINF